MDMDTSPVVVDNSSGPSSSVPVESYHFYSGDGDFDDGFGRHMFDDDDDGFPRGRTDLRAHLDDLASRHPEFAEHLRSPPGWVSDLRSSGGGGGAGWEKKRSGSKEGFFDGDRQEGERIHHPPAAHEQAAAASSSSSESAHPPHRGDGLGQHGLRSTAPDIGPKSQTATDVRNQRSMSAPPDSNRTQMNNDRAPPHQQRFVSKIEINPVNPATGQTAADMAKPPMAPPKQQSQQQTAAPQPQQQPSQQPQHKQSTVRHIPIFVEGRDEPVLPKNIDHDFSSAPPPPPSSRQQPAFTAHHQFQQHQQPQQTQQPQPQPQRKPQPTQQHEHPPDQTDSSTAQPPQAKVNQNDPIYKVLVIQKDVDELRRQVEAFAGQSRSDKEYIYLDEMLTRNLIKLDDILTDGKENIRAARKEAIKCIQEAISVLESKVPVEPSSSKDDERTMETDEVTSGTGQTGQPPASGVDQATANTASSTQEERVSTQRSQSEEKMSVDSPNSQQAQKDESFSEIKC